MTTAEAINTLNARVCACGAPKVRRTAFCGACYAALPVTAQTALWRKIGRGFEEAYEAAVARLRADGLVK
jgi:hypothetical protein